jgi:hypothetical protein
MRSKCMISSRKPPSLASLTWSHTWLAACLLPEKPLSSYHDVADCAIDAGPDMPACLLHQQ